MKRRRIKFVWGASEVIRGHWRFGLFGFYDRAASGRDDGLAISVRGVLLWGGGAALLAYLAFATALFWFWQNNPYNLLTFEDALFRPLRREQVRDLQGQAFIAQGTDALRAKRYGEAIALLRQGLTYHPNDLKARLTLVQFYVAVNQRTTALKILQDGLGSEFPGRIFLQSLLDLAEQGEDFDLAMRVGDRFLPQLEGVTAAADRRWLLARQFSALMAAEHFSEAEVLANSEDPGDGASEHRVLALLGRQRLDEALAALAEWGSRPGADVRAVARLRARTLREAGRFDEMEAALEQLRALSPSDPRSQVFGVVQRAMGGRELAALAAFDDFIFRFGGSTQNLQLLVEPLAEIGQVALVERCAALAADHGYEPEPFQTALVQAYLQRGEWAAAGRIFAAIKPPATVGRTAAAAVAWREWMKRLLAAATGTGDTAGPALVEFLHQRPWPMKIFRKSIEALHLANRLETTRDVIALAAGVFPASAWLQMQKVTVAGELAVREAAAVKALPVVVPERLPQENIFFQKLEASLGEANWTIAEQLIREARSARPPPGWIAARDGDLRLAQIQIAQAKGESTEMLVAAKLFLNGDVDQTQKVLVLARTFYAKGDKADAVALAKEVLRISPDAPVAQLLLKEWQPRPVNKK